MLLSDSFYMDLALNEAWNYQFLTYPNPAVGALVLGKYGEILAIEAHEKAGEAHAEVKALIAAFAKLRPDMSIEDLKTSTDMHDFLIENNQELFHACSIYTTLAPCNHVGKTPSCTALLQKLSLKRIVIGSADPYSLGGIELLKESGMLVELGVEKERCDDLLAPFLAWKQKKPFSFFKMAQQMNGSFDGGIISNETSRVHVHKLRSVIDVLLIGGNTVRIDRPILDTRLIKGGRNPDVIIYSKSSEFDKSIPLFGLKDRVVSMCKDKELLLEHPFTMIEGGSGMFEALKDSFDWILIYVSAAMAAGANISSSLETKIMHIMPMGGDYLFWMKRV